MLPSNDPHKEFKKAYSKKHKAYVLITCDEPTDSGGMKVAMTYGGSLSLANMLIEGGSDFLNQELENSINEFEDDEIVTVEPKTVPLRKSQCL